LFLLVVNVVVYKCTADNVVGPSLQNVLRSVLSRVRTIPRKAPNIRYPIIFASSDTNTQYQYLYRA